MRPPQPEPKGLGAKLTYSCKCGANVCEVPSKLIYCEKCWTPVTYAKYSYPKQSYPDFSYPKEGYSN